MGYQHTVQRPGFRQSGREFQQLSGWLPDWWSPPRGTNLTLDDIKPAVSRGGSGRAYRFIIKRTVAEGEWLWAAITREHSDDPRAVCEMRGKGRISTPEGRPSNPYACQGGDHAVWYWLDWIMREEAARRQDVANPEQPAVRPEPATRGWIRGVRVLEDYPGPALFHRWLQGLMGEAAHLVEVRRVHGFRLGEQDDKPYGNGMMAQHQWWDGENLQSWGYRPVIVHTGLPWHNYFDTLAHFGLKPMLAASVEDGAVRRAEGVLIVGVEELEALERDGDASRDGAPELRDEWSDTTDDWWSIRVGDSPFALVIPQVGSALSVAYHPRRGLIHIELMATADAYEEFDNRMQEHRDILERVR